MINHMQRDALAFTIRRAAVLGAGVLLFLALVYRPAQTIFRSTGDVSLYRAYARQALADPTRLPQEYPPLSALIFVVPQLILPDRYALGFALFAALATWLTILIVDRLSGRGFWLLSYLLLSAFGTLFFRYDIFVVL